MVIYEPESVKGFPEYLPPESQKYEAIKDIIKKQFQLHGFLPIKTSTIEFDELMRSDTLEEDEAVSDRFRLHDKGGRNLGLRYEFTFQLARIFKQHPNFKLPFRRYQIGSVFRDEPTGSDRYREFMQCDADIIGEPSIKADVECILLWNDIFKELKINAKFNLNHKQLAHAILDSIKIEKKTEVLRELDKIEKLGEDAVKGNIRKYADTNQVITLFKLLEKDLNFFVKNAFEGAEELHELIKQTGLAGSSVSFNPFLVRGLPYYTGPLVEVKAEGTKSSIAGGGRYDKVVGKYLGRDMTATGISASIERLMEIARVKHENTNLLIISLDQQKEARRLAQKLRKNNISCILSEEKAGKALEYANSYAIPYIVFIGKEELKKKKLKLKDMASGEEKYFAESQLIKELSKNRS